eukprot:TRINITY_DN212_c0_g1_i1.p1 TRINITY_DN212_c0_g1~~TRINITY_DN212_c0_g1_i1.p1  ORF type:complete len:191 (-),score=36.26 TRINITY_DN212_c0_g1_i1:179-751(-)
MSTLRKEVPVHKGGSSVPSDAGTPTQLVVLKWDRSIDSSMEFRCFVHRKRLAAVSQYDCYSVWPLLQVPDRVREIKGMIEHFHDQIKGQLPYESCVMDVVLKPRTKIERDEERFKTPRTDLNIAAEMRVYLIEFNPFFIDGSSGSSLFEWERDRAMIYFGGATGETVFRVRVDGSAKIHSKQRALVLDYV